MSALTKTFLISAFLICAALTVVSLPTSSQETSRSRNICGMRQFSALVAGNGLFPWLVRLSVQRNDNDETVLCSGSAVSQYVVVVPAACVAGREKERLTVALPSLSSDRRTDTKYFEVTSIVIHQVCYYQKNPKDVCIILENIFDKNNKPYRQLICALFSLFK